MMDNNWNIGEDGLQPDNGPMWTALAREGVDDSYTVNRPEDPRIQQEAKHRMLFFEEDMQKLKEAVRAFVRREYDDELTEEAFDNPACIGIAETTAEDREDIVIDMAVNLRDMTLDQYINGDKMDSWYYADVHALINELNHISFDELVSLGPNAAQHIEQLCAQFPEEHDFIRNPEDGFAIYQLRADPKNQNLRFSSMSELRREAQQLRDDVHHVVESGEDILFANKSAVEKYLRDEGFTIVPNSDPSLITIQSAARMEATIYLAYGNDCCHIDGCDTRGADHVVKKEHYAWVYSNAIPDECLSMKTTDEILEGLFTKFNIDRPADFHGHSLSVSDVIVLKQNGQVNSYYTDSFGFEKLPAFLSRDNPLRTAEMCLEDDYGMIDGIINNGTKEESKSLKDAINKDAPKPCFSPKNEHER